MIGGSDGKRLTMHMDAGEDALCLATRGRIRLPEASVAASTTWLGRTSQIRSPSKRDLPLIGSIAFVPMWCALLFLLVELVLLKR